MTVNLTNEHGFNVRDDLKDLDVESLIQVQAQSSLPLCVAMFNVVRDFNLASVVRNACVFGVSQIHIIGWRKYDRRGTVGAHNYIEMVHHPTYKDFCMWCCDHGYDIVALEHLPGVSRSIYDFSWSPKSMILVGEEGQGISALELTYAHHIVHIPQYGVLRSLNAAVASGIAINSYMQHYR